MSPAELITQVLQIFGGKTKKRITKANNYRLLLRLNKVLEGFSAERALIIAQSQKNSTQILVLTAKRHQEGKGPISR